VTAMGQIYLYYGTGGGKTTAALGIALRSVAHGHHVTIIQFLKHWKETGEYKAAKTLGSLYDIRQFGRQGWIKAAKDGDEVRIGGFKATLRKTSEEDKLAAAEAMRYAERVLKGDHPPELIILDEVCLAAHMGIVETADVLALLDKLPQGTDAILTGRFTPQKLIDRADFVNEVREVKAPPTFVSREGIQF
jgi:cob(I)alamin adenosyltransferase